ncbi:signal peptidase II [Saccharomonospora amisosensis]
MHAGRFPTFNAADTLITVGVVLLVLASLLQPSDRRERT